MNSTGNRIAIIDPVGIKAGMDHYDLLLASGLQKNGAIVAIYSNIAEDNDTIPVHRYFYNTGVSKPKAIWSNFFGFIKALQHAKAQKIEWLILHVFRAGMFDLVTFLLARLMGFRICAIVHDIESLDTYSLPLVRKSVIRKLPDVRVVHNDFSKKELFRSLGEIQKTHVIPHVNFLDLFAQRKTLPPDPVNIHPDLPEVLKDNIPCFLFFGQIKNAKGIDLLLEAACQVKGDFRVIIAGKVREGSWKHYEQMIRALNLRHKVLPVIRHISDQERDFLFTSATCVVLPYHKIYQSGVLLMAMSFPALVLASALPPNRDIVKDGVNGLLFDVGSSTDLALRMQSVLENQHPVEDLKKASLKQMMEYNPESIGRAYTKIIG